MSRSRGNLTLTEERTVYSVLSELEIAILAKWHDEYMRIIYARGVGESLESRRETPLEAKGCSEPGSNAGSATETMAPGE